MGALDAPAQSASFYVEKIKLAKLRALYQKWSWSRPFSGKKFPKHFKRLFLYKTQKQPLISLSGQFQLFLTFQSD